MARELRQDPKSSVTRIVMLTSSGKQGNDALCEQLGIQAYLHKPAKPAELFRAICTVMEMGPAAPESKLLATTETIRKARGSLRVLVAEDNLVNQRLALRLLEKSGDTVVLANNGREAIDCLSKGAFDVVLMDLQMPVLDGIEATAVIRDQEKTTGLHVHIIALTAHAMKGDGERCLNAGMDGYLAKPIQSKRLYELLDAVPQTLV